RVDRVAQNGTTSRADKKPDKLKSPGWHSFLLCVQADMPCFAVHSQLLFVLLVQTTYVNMSFFIFIAGQHSFHILEMNITDSSVEEVEDAFEKLKVSTSLILHWVVAVCIIACIVMNNVERISRILPTSIVVAVLIFAFFINIVGAVLLLIYNASASQDEVALKNSGFLSLCAALGSLLLAVFFAMMPTRNLMFIETHEALHVGRRPPLDVPKLETKLGLKAQKFCKTGQLRESNGIHEKEFQAAVVDRTLFALINVSEQ
ncbi:hypothetical protein GCK32_006121, partial [Trichostrongylus colubriformis]